MELVNLVKFDIPTYEESINLNIEYEINVLKSELKVLSSVSSFDDITWSFNLREKSSNSRKHLVYFKNIPTEYIEEVKLFVLLISRKSISQATDFPSKIIHLFNFCEEHFIKISKINLKIFDQFEAYISNLYNYKTNEKYHPDTCFKIWKASNLFLSTISWNSKIPYLPKLRYKNYPIKKRYKRVDKRQPICNKTLIKLDEYFSNDELPNHIKTVYWLLRLYPFRIGEIVNIVIDCIKYINNDLVMLKFPSFKNNGGFSEAVVLDTLLFIREENQKMLLNLIEKQKRIASNINKRFGIKNELLFIYISYAHNPHILSQNYFSFCFKKIQRKLQIEPLVQVHQFRTTGATLRSENGFTSVQLKELLNTDINTISHYTKPRQENFIKLQRKLIKTDKPKIYFKGKIFNSSNNFIEQNIIKNPLAHQLPDMGFCSYENKCGTHYDCLDCKYLIPDYNLLEYYKKMASEQLNKSEFWAKKGNKLYQRDSLHRATLFTKLFQAVMTIEGNVNE